MSQGDLVIQTIKEIKHPLYIEKIEKWRMPGFADDQPPTQVHCAYNMQGDYIGDIEIAKQLCDKYGIAPEKSDPNHSVCSIGYSIKHNKWYGWSHRAIVGFGIGDKIFEDDYGDDNTPFVNHGNKSITDMAGAKLAAQRFAESVASNQDIVVCASLPWWCNVE